MSQALDRFEACLEFARSLSVTVRLIPLKGAACSSILEEHLEVKVEVIVKEHERLFRLPGLVVYSSRGQQMSD
jgi:hypothetical protein